MRNVLWQVCKNVKCPVNVLISIVVLIVKNIFNPSGSI